MDILVQQWANGLMYSIDLIITNVLKYQYLKKLICEMRLGDNCLIIMIALWEDQRQNKIWFQGIKKTWPVFSEYTNICLIVTLISPDFSLQKLKCISIKCCSCCFSITYSHYQ